MGLSLNSLLSLPLFAYIRVFTLSSADASWCQILFLISKHLNLVLYTEKNCKMRQKLVWLTFFFSVRCSDTDWNKENAVLFSWPATVENWRKQRMKRIKGIREHFWNRNNGIDLGTVYILLFILCSTSLFICFIFVYILFIVGVPSPIQMMK